MQRNLDPYKREVTDLASGQSASGLNQSFADIIALDILDKSINRYFADRVALVSSFGAESVVLLHLVSQIDKTLPVIFLDTEFHFHETLEYQKSVADRLGLTNLVLVSPDPVEVRRSDPDRDLHKSNPDLCCGLRKTAPLERAVAPYGAWITGRKRHQTPQRAALELFEEGANGKIKINPLAYWSPQLLKRYILEHGLPRHPLVKAGYASIGCQPCTSPVQSGEDARAGRWRSSEKQECGIHIQDGKIVRGSRQAGEARNLI